VEAAVGRLNMTVDDVVGFDSLVRKEAIGGFEHGAVATGFGQRGPGILGQHGGKFYQACGASQVTEFRFSKFVDGPGPVIEQTARTPLLCSGADHRTDTGVSCLQHTPRHSKAKIVGNWQGSVKDRKPRSCNNPLPAGSG